jgi:hypothetical protein
MTLIKSAVFHMEFLRRIGDEGMARGAGRRCERCLSGLTVVFVLVQGML